MTTIADYLLTRLEQLGVKVSFRISLSNLICNLTLFSICLEFLENLTSLFVYVCCTAFFGGILKSILQDEIEDFEKIKWVGGWCV
jgi:hypothetical protein